MKKLATIIISLMILLSYTIIGSGIEAAELGSVGAVVLTPSPTIPETTPTVYKDWSEIKKLDMDYSHSTMFYRDNTRIQILKNGGTATWKTTNGITFPEIELHTGQEAIMIITNCAVDKDGRNLDVVVKINNVHEWRGKGEDKIFITFWRQEFLNSQINVPAGQSYDYAREIAVGELINFDLEAFFAECDFNMTYYVSGTYSYNAGNNTESGVLGNITSVNNFVYDIDVPKRTNTFVKKIFQGNEGLIPFTGDPTIYYKKAETSVDSYNTGLQELQNGICVKDSIDHNLDAIWYKNSAFITANNIRNATYSFRYGGEGCGIVYSFMSPYPYQIETPRKTVSKTKVKEQESFNYVVSQYIPNNYYGSLIKFNEVYSNLYGNTHFTNIEISDTLNENLGINGSVTITNENGEDKTNYFDIIVSGNSVRAVAKNGVLGQVDFYAHVYNMNIPVYIKAGTGGELTSTSSINNKANVIATLEGENTNLDSNTVSTGLYYDITTSIENGSITPSQSVDIHESRTIRIDPSSGYYVYSITINGEEQEISNYYEGGSINLSNITKDYNIVVKTRAYGQAQITKRDTRTTENLEGAVIGLYYDTACTIPVEGKERLVTGATGTVLATKLRQGVYYAKEIQAPNNYTLNNTVQKITIYPGQTTPVLVENMPNMAKIEVSKLDDNTGKKISKEETKFALYEWSTTTNTWELPTHINTATVKDGNILIRKEADIKGTYTATIYYNAQNQGKYKVVELERPFGYTTTNWETQIQVTQDGQIFSYNTEVRNTQVKGQINFKKNDSQVNYKNEMYEENYAQADATLQGATYGLYAKENILSPDDGSILYPEGKQIAIKETDGEGKITWENLYLGKYYIQEIIASTGYVKDQTKYEVDLQNYYHNVYFTQGDQTTQNIVYKNTTEDLQYDNIEQRVIGRENIIKQSFQLTKLEISEDSDMGNPLQGAGFKIYLISELSKVKDGTITADTNGNYNAKDFLNYNFTNEQTAMTFNENMNGERIPELFSNEDGIVISPELAYGKYIVIESTTPPNVKTIEPFIVNIQEDSRTPKKMIYPIDREFEARIEIVKKDSTTGKRVLKENAAYRIWDVVNNEYIEQWVTYPNKVKYGTEKNPYRTSEEGYLLTPEVLAIGEYELREIEAPKGYVLAGKEENPQSNVRFTISTNSVYEIDPDLGKRNAIIIVEQSNIPQVGSILISKEGEFLSQAQEREGSYQIEYSKRPVTDAEFAIYAKEDIYTQDNQGEKLYEKDQLVRQAVVNQEGKVRFENLPLGKYYVKETKAGNGFVLNTEEKEVELAYQGQEQNVVYQEVEYTNERQKIEITIIKKDREKGTTLQGAEFGLYTKEEIPYQDNSGNSSVIPANQLIGKASSGEDGRVIFNHDSLPLGKYYIKELVAPKGYAINPERVEFDCSYMGQNVTRIEKNVEFTNQKTKLEIRVIDHETEVDLVGTQIALKSEDGELIGNYTIDNRGKIEVEGLEVGKEYKIEEIQTRKDYVKELLFKENTEDENELPKGKEQNGIVTFRIKDSEVVQKVTLRNMAKVGKLVIEKTGEVLTNTEKDSNGNIIFHYDTQKIDTASFEISVKESIVHPDGKQGVIAQVGTIIGEGQTKNGILTIEKFSEELIQEQPEVMQLLLQRGLPLGEYEIKETKAPNGYYYQKQKSTVNIEKRDDNSPIEQYKITIQNQRQVTNIGRPNPSIKIEKQAEKKVYQVGEEVIYHINVTNTGNTVLKNIEVQESMLNGEFYQTEGIVKQENNKVTIDKLEIEEQKTLVYRYRLTEQDKGKVDNRVTTIATPVKIVLTPDGEKEETLEPIMDEAQEEIWSDTLIDKTVNKKIVKPGDLIEYTLVITNPFEEEIKDAIIEDEKIGAKSVISSSKKGITVENGKIILGNLQAKEKVQIVYQYVVPKDYKENELINTAKLKGTKNKIPIVSEEVTTTVAVKKSGMEITKQADKEQYLKGEVVNYTIKVTNTGETELKEITIKEELINGKFDEKTGITVIDNQTVKIEKLERGQSINLSYRYKVEEEKLVGEKIRNKVTATGTGMIENIENPEQTIIEEIYDEAEKEVIITNQEEVYEQKLGIYKTDLETGDTIKGALFGLYAAENIVDNHNKILIEKNSLIEKVMTDKSGYAKFTADLPIARYYIKEIKPASGYKENTEKIEIDATTINSSEKEYPVKLEVQNEKTQINIEKIEKKERIEDITQREQVLGAKLQILEEDKVIDEWITEEEPHNIKGLETQKEYTLHEAKPADGYVTANDFKFHILLDGSLEIEADNTIETEDIPTVVMQDDVTKVKILVVDKETKEPIKDIVLQIVDKETGEVVHEFTTDGEEQIIEKIPIGNYEIKEKEYPKDKGYVSIETEEFTVEDTPEVQEKVIEQNYTKLDISFIDEITKKLLPGGKLEIRNKEGNVVHTIDKTDEHTYIERLPAGEYTIVEIDVPEGYEPLGETKFTLKDTPEIQYVILENKRLPFDLQVEKYASEVFVNGKKQTGANKTGQLVKIEIDGKKIAKQNVEITYTIKVTNVGKVAGGVGEIVDKVPLGLTFNASKNETYWKANGNTITTTEFADRKIKPQESIELKITLDWTRSEFNLGEKENIVTIGKFSNGPGFEDKEKENNQSSSSILISVKTGLELVLTNQITALILLELCVIALIATIEIAFLNKKRRKK